MSETKTHIIADRLRLCRKEAHETLDQLARLADVNKSTVLRWERGETAKINRPTLQRLADHFGVDVNWLAGADVPRTRESAPASSSILQPEDLPGLLQLPNRPNRLRQTSTLPATPWEGGFTFNDDSGFWLHVEDDCMAPILNKGDIVRVHCQPTVEDGQFAVLLLDGVEGVIRRVQSGVNWIELSCLNPHYPPRIFTGDDLLRVRVLGRITESRRLFQ